MPLTTSLASAPMAWPTCRPKTLPPIWRIIGAARSAIPTHRGRVAQLPGPSSDCACWVITPAIAVATLSATGSTSRCHTGRVPSTHSARLQVSARAPAGAAS